MKTTKENVLSQLMYAWDEEQNNDGEYVPVKGQQLMSEEQAKALIEKHNDIFEQGQLMGSFAYYTANQILNAERLQ